MVQSKEKKFRKKKKFKCEYQKNPGKKRFNETNDRAKKKKKKKFKKMKNETTFNVRQITHKRGKINAAKKKKRKKC